ncbi:MAG: UDP-N-acetylmuramate dehydrogenase [Anaerolineales bacterium]|nr:UDP-N-acetylmuramate dehydrogenase [Anaerolineales bacterium]
MSLSNLTSELRDKLRDRFGAKLQFEEPLARYTSARIGGPAEALISVRSADELAHAARELWGLGLGFRIIGGGSNILIADEGIRGVVLLNRAREVRFLQEGKERFAVTESGAVLGTVARLAAERGWGGLEWAATVPGTVGGAVVGNAGAHGGDMAHSITMAEILQHEGQVESWPLKRLDFGYRTSALKGKQERFVVLSATFTFDLSTPEACKQKMHAFSVERERTQPAGASMGSMFKNPPGDYAGRLIEAAGLKGLEIGGVKISEKHANFFINEGRGQAADVYKLIATAQQAVQKAFGTELELEIELVGEWPEARERELSNNGAAR